MTSLRKFMLLIHKLPIHIKIVALICNIGNSRTNCRQSLKSFVLAFVIKLYTSLFNNWRRCIIFITNLCFKLDVIRSFFIISDHGWPDTLRTPESHFMLLFKIFGYCGLEFEDESVLFVALVVLSSGRDLLFYK